MDKKIAYSSVRNVLIAGVYIFGVSQLMYYGDDIFGKVDNNLAPFVMLLLFSASAAIVGGLVFGPAVMLFLDNKKKESVKAAIYSVLWLLLLTLIAIIILILV